MHETTARSDRELIAVRTLTFDRADGVGTSELKLNTPVFVYGTATSAATLCRMCVARLNLPTLDRVLLGMLLDDCVCGGYRQYSYAELGCALGKGAHSAERSVARLRREGLLLTTRIGRDHASVAFNCDALFFWAENLLKPFKKQDRGESASPVSPLVSPSVELPSAEYAKDASVPDARKRPSDASATKEAISVLPAVADAPAAESAPLPTITAYAGPAPHRHGIPAGQKNYLSLSSSEIQNLPEAELAIYFEQYRKAQIARYTREDGTLYPGTYFNEDGMPQFDTASGYPCPPFLLPSTGDEEPVDPSQEIAASIAAQGGVNDTSSDELSFGAEVVETDFSPNVHVNPDI